MIKREANSTEFPIIIEEDKEVGGYVVYCPTLKGCVSQGETEEEAIENIKDAIQTYLASLEELKKHCTKLH